MPTLLLIADAPSVTAPIAAVFEEANFQVVIKSHPKQGLATFEDLSPDALVIYVNTPANQPKGLRICKTLRHREYMGVLVVISSCNTEADRILGFQTGVDHYLPLQVSPAELHARVAAVLRRNTPASQSTYTYPQLVIDLDNYVIRHPTHEVSLANREQQLLRYLIEHRQKVVSRQEILTRIWHYTPNASTRTVDTHIQILRKKLLDNATKPVFIETAYGVGYRFIATEQQAATAH